MKVLVLSNLYPPDVIGGYELGCKQVVDALRARGHDVRVLTTAPRTPVPGEPHVARQLQLSEVWNDYMYRHSSPVTSRLLQAESTLVSAFNVHALARVLEEFRPDVAYIWMIVGVGGLGLMATLQHLKVPWLWHLMDDVPVAICRPNGRVIAPLLREVDRQLDGRYLACSRQLVDEVEAAGVRLRPGVEVVPNWVVGGAPHAPHQLLPPRTDSQGHRRGADQREQGGRLHHRDRRHAPEAGHRAVLDRLLRQRRRPLFPGPGERPGAGRARHVQGVAAPGRAGPALPPSTTSSPSQPGLASRSPSPPWRPRGEAASR